MNLFLKSVNGKGPEAAWLWSDQRCRETRHENATVGSWIFLGGWKLRDLRVWYLPNDASCGSLANYDQLYLGCLFPQHSIQRICVERHEQSWKLRTRTICGFFSFFHVHCASSCLALSFGWTMRGNTCTPLLFTLTCFAVLPYMCLKPNRTYSNNIYIYNIYIYII